MANSDSIYEQFIQQHHNYKNAIKELSELGLTLYHSENCGYCRNMISLLSPYKKYIVYKNVVDPDVIEDIKLNHKKCTGFPYFTSQRFHSYHLGATPTVERLIQSLRSNENNLLVQEEPESETKVEKQQPISITA